MTWDRVRISDLDDAELESAFQVDRQGEPAPAKTDGSARTVPIPAHCASILAAHRGRATHTAETNFVFCTRTGKAFSQRNTARALRGAQTKAVTSDSEPTFPALHAVDDAGEPVPAPRGTIPSMHGFRHTVASRALLAGESIDEVAFLLGHRDANVTGAVYVRELADVRRRSMRRSNMTAEFADILGEAGED